MLCTSVVADLHELGIRAVANHLEWSGWKAVLLGASTPTADLILAISDFEIDLVAVSANTALHVPATIELVAAIRNSERPVKVLVGGRPFMLAPELWKTVGADACAISARNAAEAAISLFSAG